MKKKTLRRILSVLFAVLVPFSAAGCGNTKIGTSLEGVAASGMIEMDNAGGTGRFGALLSDLTSSLNFESYEISQEESDRIDQEIFYCENMVFADLASDLKGVQTRDWSEYHTDYTESRLAEEELVLWKRFEVMAEDYMNNCSMNAVKFSNGNLYGYGITYDDLGLSWETVKDMALWFMYTHPQYWFFSYGVVGTKGSQKTVHLGIYDKGADGYDRAAVTNSLYETIDRMAGEIAAQGSSEEKVRYANELICDELSYNLEAPYKQTMYSSFVLKESTCAGYAGAMTVLLNKAGVAAVSIISSTHAWNAVQMEDGKWYGEDASWNDGGNRERYLLVSETNLKKDDSGKEAHNVVSYAEKWVPELSAEDYKPAASQAAPEAPEKLTCRYYDSERVEISWTPVSNADRYTLEVTFEGEKNGSSWEFETTKAMLKGVTDSCKLTARVRATGVGGSSDWTACEYTHVPPERKQVSAPANFTVSGANSDTLTLRWDAVKDMGYEIELYSDSGYTALLAKSKVNGDGASAAIVFSGLFPEQTYYVRLRAVEKRDDADAYSEWVNISGVTAKKEAVSQEESSITFSAPRNLEQTFINDSTVRVTWQAVESATGYEVIIYSDENCTRSIGSITTKDTLVYLTSVSKDKKYYVRIRSVSTGKDDTRYSGWAMLTVSGTEGAEAKQLAAPTELQWSVGENGLVQVRYNTLREADHYEVALVYEGQEKAFQTSEQDNPAKNKPGVSVRLVVMFNGFPRDKAVYVKVRAIAAEGSGMADSDWTSVKVYVPSQGAAIEKPGDLSCKPEEDDRGTVYFRTIKGAAGYEVEFYHDASYTDRFFFAEYENPENAGESYFAIRMKGFPRGEDVYIRVRTLAAEGSGLMNSDWVTLKVNLPK